MNAFFDDLRRKIFAERYLLGGIAEEMQETRRILREIDKYAYEQSEPFRRQLDYLRDSAASPYPLPTLHHDLDVVASQFELEIQEASRQAPSICSIAIGAEYRASVEPCLRSARAYCRKHGYNHILIKEKPFHFKSHLYWIKFPLLWAAMKWGTGDLFYLDTDALISNPAIKLETFFQRLDEKRREILIARDSNGVNCGLYFIKNSLRARVLLHLFWEHRQYYSYTWIDFGDQSIFHDLLNRYLVIESLFLEAPQRDFNSYVSGGPAGTWQKGDFILHFASAEKERMNDVIRGHGIELPPA